MTDFPKEKFLYSAVALVFLTLPFTKGMTLNVGFPLKIYEIILLLAIPYWTVRGGRPWERPAFWWPLVMFLSVVFCSLVYNLWGQSWAGAGGWIFVSRFGPWGDGLTKFLYSIFVFGAFFLICSVAKKDWARLTDWWLAGAVVGAGLSLHFALSSYFGGALLSLPGLERHQTALFLGQRVIRSGCFHEGNFAALYFVLSVALSLHRGKVFPAFFFSLACLSTFSSLGMMGCTMVWAGSAFSSPRASRLRTGIGAMAVFLTMGALQLSSGYLSDVFINKFLNDKILKMHVSPGSKDHARNSGSLGVRYKLMKESLRLWARAPILGVGLSQFGYQCQWHQKGEDLERIVEKPIPNNVYLEILSETGVLGFFALFVFALRVLCAGWKNVGWSPLSFGLLSLIVGLNTYPSYSVLFIWGFLALWVESPVGETGR